MTLNEIRDEVYACAEKKGFHEAPFNFGESLMLIVSELVEAFEAHRRGEPFEPNARIDGEIPDPESVGKSSDYKLFIKESIAEEIADAIIRLCDLAGCTGIDIDWHVKAKMSYNKTRPWKHGKKY